MITFIASNPMLLAANNSCQVSISEEQFEAFMEADLFFGGGAGLGHFYWGFQWGLMRFHGISSNFSGILWDLMGVHGDSMRFHGCFLGIQWRLTGRCKQHSQFGVVEKTR